MESERWMVAAFIFLAVSVGVIAQAWVSWLEHKRRTKALDVIKAAIEAGREPPPQVYQQLESDPMAGLGMSLSEKPWGEGLLFAALGAAFWIAVVAGDPSDRNKYMLVAGVMSASAVFCFGLAAFRSQRKRDDER